MVGITFLILHLITHFSLTTGILTTKGPWEIQSETNQQFLRHHYPDNIATVFPKVSQSPTDTNHALDNELKNPPSSEKSITERHLHVGYSYIKPTSLEFKLPSKNQVPKIPTNHRSTYNVGRITHDRGTESTRETLTTSTTRPEAEVEYHPHVSRGMSSYRVVEEHDEYLTDDSDHSGLPHRGKIQTTYPHRDSQDITTAIKALDHFLSRALNDDGYNSELHPPPNPVLALVLSRYGRYVPGARNPRVYAYMAVNNIHNSKPFGRYKLECEEEPTYVSR